MSKNLLNISGKISEPLISIYALIADIAAQNHLPFFIIGATARDIIFEHVYGIKAPRATKDIDLAVQVATWKDFEQLKNQLIATGQLISDKMVQRLRYRGEIPVDIVPFGDIEANGNILWPPEYSIKMSVTGFQEAYENTQLVRLRESPALDVHVVTPVGLMVLKIIAWSERYPQAQKDALDIAFILRNYIGEWNRARLYDHYVEIIEAEDYDEVRAGARMLGREMSKILSSSSRQIISKILLAQTGEQEHYRLVEDIRERFEENLELLEALKRGLHDEPPTP
jgi:predicted nucleotidyltransferase